MEVTPRYINDIVTLAKEIETQDPIDWSMLSIREDDAYRLIALNTLEHLTPKYADPFFKEIVVATIVKLVVENFVLNTKVAQLSAPYK